MVRRYIISEASDETMVDLSIKVECMQTACMYYRECNEIGMALCSHPHKEGYLQASPCPLYRLDWKKQTGAGSAKDLLDVLNRPR